MRGPTPRGLLLGRRAPRWEAVRARDRRARCRPCLSGGLREGPLSDAEAAEPALAPTQLAVTRLQRAVLVRLQRGRVHAERQLKLHGGHGRGTGRLWRCLARLLLCALARRVRLDSVVRLSLPRALPPCPWHSSQAAAVVVVVHAKRDLI